MPEGGLLLNIVFVAAATAAFLLNSGLHILIEKMCVYVVALGSWLFCGVESFDIVVCACCMHKNVWEKIPFCHFSVSNDDEKATWDV